MLYLATTIYDMKGDTVGDTFIMNVDDRKDKVLKIMDDAAGNMKKMHDNNYGIVDFVLMENYKAIYKRRYSIIEGDYINV